MAQRDNDGIELSIIIKTLNEAANIQRTIAAARTAAAQFAHEIIVADSLSDDDTAALAKAEGARVIQLLNRADRSCGIGAQLGFQIARGRYIYLLDGDMECVPGFVDQAVARLKASDRLAGVAGDMAELQSGSYEFKQRQRQFAELARGEWHGEKDWLDGGGIYKRAALDELGYVTDRNLHAYEEKDLGLRLKARGWQMLRIASQAVAHRGHKETTWPLLKKRWATKYINGSGDFLRACLGEPYFWRAVLLLKQYVALALLLCLTAAASLALLWSPWPIFMCLSLWAMAALALAVRKRSLFDGLRSLGYLSIWAAGLLRGVLSPRTNPRAPIACKEL